MGRGQRTHDEAATASRPSRAQPRAFRGWETDALDQATLTESNAARRREIERELWRRPGGSGFQRGQKIGPLLVDAIDPDRLRILVRLENGGVRSMTQNQLIDLLSDGSIPYPTEPDKRTPPTPVDYGQHTPVAREPHPSHLPLGDHPESAPLAAERKRIDDQRDHMTVIRPDTDIVEFERLYWQQGVASLKLARDVEAAGGLDPAAGAWGTRYVNGIPAFVEAETERRRGVYEHIRGMRERGESDEAIITYLEAEYESPFGGPQSAGG
jgi:hypothetical protein